ncbi:TlpA family protein disulfide reductase [Agromyces salentinus]|uniref:Thioredoxin family protein n=1 Tax=Agromyces salentinus TaxID=269421 RepID=A0ABN2MZW7_9MICO|nr:thioredoxin family protein [Agromyces salentinus]
MDWPAALIAGLALPAVATAIGLVWRSRTGRLRVATRTDAASAAPGDVGAVRSGRTAAALALDLRETELGEAATLVQFSTEFCSRCPATARGLRAIADDFAGVRHVEVDLTRRADLADRFAVRETPTTLILAADGTLSARIGGVPRTGAVRSHLETLTGSSHVAS